MDIGEVNEKPYNNQETVKVWIEDVNTGEYYEEEVAIDAIGKGKAKGKGKKGYVNDGLCNKCGKPGHYARDCKGEVKCHGCKGTGHMKAQ